MPNGKKQTTGYNEIIWKDTNITEGFWEEIQRRILQVTLPIEYEQCLKTGRISALECDWKPGDPYQPHFFWDSDIAKWIEAASYSLALCWDESLIEKVDKIVDSIEKAQQEDGYFNIYYTVVEPGQRFTYLKRMHELYCLGHMIEGAVAYHQVTGKTKLLDIVSRYADLLCTLFGSGEGQIRGYDGHPEIELALVKLYKTTGQQKYLTLSKFFVDERGTSPSFFEKECEQRGEPEENRKYRFDMQGMYAYYQAHMPVREQTRAVGHAVRAMYLYSGMADVATYTDDASLHHACKTLWDNVVQRQMYVTGGIGPNPSGERFTYDYNLPNSMAYNETCASIGLFMFTYRMMLTSPHGEYGDVMERCLYNNILGGVSLSGDRFYYANPLSAHPAAYQNMNEDRSHITLMRQKWFEVACCPPNLARLMMSLSGYIYIHNQSSLIVNLFINSSTDVTLNDTKVTVSQQSNYPWEPSINIAVAPAKPCTFTLQLRLASWSKKYQIKINGMLYEEYILKDGFLCITREWNPTDVVELLLDMHVRRIEARPEVTADCGRIALERGPIVYCFEETDNGKNLEDITLTTDVIQEVYSPDLLGGIVALTMTGYQRTTQDWPQQQLYREQENGEQKMALTAIPFYSRLNRTSGEMIVWIKS